MNSLYHFTKEECRTAHPETILCRMLSTTATLPATPYIESHGLGLQIGKGQCGTIHTFEEYLVRKTPNSANKINELRRDAQLHAIVKTAFSNAPNGLARNVSVPERYRFRCPPANGDEFGDWIRLPGSHDIDHLSVHNYDLMSERIFPLHDPIPECILASLIPKSTHLKRSTCLSKPENNNCLVRIYLGRRGVDRSKTTTENVSLRNFPLHVDEMERLNLPISMYTTAIAEALALMHWKAGIDANDVEFVLGSSRRTGPMFPVHGGETGQSVSIWLLDFNQCQKFEHDQAGLKRLVNGFWWNDPYYPRPDSGHKTDKALWTTFLSKYLDASALLTDSDLPKRFIEAVEEEGYRRRVKPSLFG
ncbi:hypothetical protein D6C78_01334 [Aureobasidium pullulans]|uniref:DUF3669 domain-containing protein n=1 Tax=Aureobasidium pullulans TaxID=5580 RepID=A0A4T0C466_AURPU|nr:hypothetical protein D6C78_01334 [Aureobasidium pullulans]